MSAVSAGRPSLRIVRIPEKWLCDEDISIMSYVPLPAEKSGEALLHMGRGARRALGKARHMSHHRKLSCGKHMSIIDGARV